jgi:hypothetical protein
VQHVMQKLWFRHIYLVCSLLTSTCCPTKHQLDVDPVLCSIWKCWFPISHSHHPICSLMSSFPVTNLFRSSDLIIEVENSSSFVIELLIFYFRDLCCCRIYYVSLFIFHELSVRCHTQKLTFSVVWSFTKV